MNTKKNIRTIVRVVDKENGGHGDAVNFGLRVQHGKYFKVVDSDDWVKEDSLHRILQTLRGSRRKRARKWIC